LRRGGGGRGGGRSSRGQLLSQLNGVVVGVDDVIEAQITTVG